MLFQGPHLRGIRDQIALGRWYRVPGEIFRRRQARERIYTPTVEAKMEYARQGGRVSFWEWGWAACSCFSTFDKRYCQCMSSVVPNSHIFPDQETPLVAERATVNILNTQWEPSSPRSSAINKHFEIPASLATLAASAAHGRGPDIPGQYAQNAGRRSILA
jgi:hypothetical protein